MDNLLGAIAKTCTFPEQRLWKLAKTGGVKRMKKARDERDSSVNAKGRKPSRVMWVGHFQVAE
jgi:hypothetical protein